MRECSRCGAGNEDTAAFCTSCEEYLGWDDAGVPASARRALHSVDEGRRLAGEHDRPDLADGLQQVQSRLRGRSLPIAVVGEFKRGKSTLVNALLQTAVCPVDTDLVTALPTFVRYGEPAAAVAHLEPGDGAPRNHPVELDDIERLVSDVAGRDESLRSLEVRLPHRMLRSGLCLVDTPGVGGLDSAHGLVTLGALDQAEGLVFVTDASQELSAPEVEFLRMALQRCPKAICVVTKTDLYPEWRRIAELDRGHLRRQRIEIDVLPVSSFLRLRARQHADVGEESGFRPLVRWLAEALLAREQQAAQEVAQEVRFVSAQLTQQVEAERAVVSEPDAAPVLTRRLEERRDDVARLSRPGATWQQTLGDGIEDLRADVTHDLQGRLRQVRDESVQIIDQGDPRESWPTIESWLRRRVAEAAVANQDLLAARVDELVDAVAAEFELEVGDAMRHRPAEPDVWAGGVGFSTTTAFTGRANRLSTLLSTARGTIYLPMIFFGVAINLVTAAVVLPVTAALGAGIGAKVFKDERTRQLVYRRQQAKGVATKYVADVEFVVIKDCQDSLRGTQRHLRAVFQRRASSLERSSVTALASAERARGLAPAERERRGAELADQADRLRALDAAAAGVGPAQAAVA